MKRKPITWKMKEKCLLGWGVSRCYLCHEQLLPGEKIEYDHIHAVTFDGPHEWWNIHPVHVKCHKAKTARDIKANAKVKRLRGETKKPKRKKAWPKRKMESRPFRREA